MESGKPRSSSSGDASRACKYYCIACLNQINTKNAKAVFQDWPLLFGQPRGGLTSRSVSNVLDMTRPDQALSVRTAAIHLCEAALEQAGREGLLIVIDDRPQRSSAFISLAARTGAVVSDIRLCIASILTLASTSSSLSEGSSSLTLAALKAAKALITSTPNVAYRQRSADILTPPVVSLCSSLDSSTAATAFSVLSELMGASTGNNAAIQAMPVDGILAQLLQSEPHLATVRTQAWKALSSVFEQSVQDTNLHSRQVLELCHQTLKQSPSDLERQAAMSMLPLLLRKEARQTSLSADQSEVFQTVTSLGVKDVNPLVRCSAADCVLPLAASSDVPIHRRPAHELLERLLSDSEAAVCAAAARAIGVCFDTGEAVAALQLEKTDVKDSNIAAFIAFATGSRLLRTGRCDEEDARKHPSGGPLHARAMIVKMRASWSFATMCDKSADQVANAPASATRPLLTELLRLAIALSKDDDRVAANGLRALGALLRASPSSIDMESYPDLRQTQDSGFAVVIDLLQKAKDPKIRWNAGAALERAFSNVGLLEQICSQKTGAMTIQRLYDDIVGAACGDKMYKVKLASLQALVRIHSSAEQLGGPTNDTVCTLLQEQRPRLRAAKDDLEERAETAPFKERQLHVDPCRKALEALLLRGSKANDDSLRDR
ncbi:hypothetical protein OC861_003630 [Tilletia horrida]|nr:hypothetical protein OC861_003630 [Tilletia horrida]